MKKLFRGWYVVIALAVIYSCSNGLLINSVGVLFAGIIKQEGFKASELSVAHTIRYFVTSFVLTTNTRLFFQCRRPALYLAGMGVVSALAFAAASLYTRPWHFYISAFAFALGSSGILAFVPIIVNNWFKKYAGTITGVILMMAGVACAVFNPLISRIIEAFGWRTMCLLFAASAVVLWIIPALLFVEASPEGLGLSPYGEPEKAEKEAAGPDIREHPPMLFVLAVIALVLPGGAVPLIAQLPTFAISVGYSLTVGAVISSCAMVGNLSSKPLIGLVSDKTGAINAMIFFVALTSLGLLIILAGAASPLLLYAGALLLGLCYAMTTGTSLVFSEIYGKDGYREKLARCLAVSYFVLAIGSYLYPAVYDLCGSWYPVFAMVAVTCLSCLIILFYLKKKVKEERAV